MLREQTAANPERMRRALEGLRRYQQAERDPPPEAMPVIESEQGATLRDYGGTGPSALFVPSLINPPNILDLARDQSLLRWLATNNIRVLMLDWGWPDARRSTMSIGDHIDRILVPLINRIGAPVHLVGYCLGGTMAAAAAQLAPVRSLATIAAPWDFAGFPDEALRKLADLWESARGTTDALGLMPMEALQSAFWSLDPGRTIAKYEAFALMDGPQARSFVTLEDWANDGPPLAGATAHELFEHLFAANRPGSGQWQVGGQRIDPEGLQCPIFNIVSTRDRIVPAATALPCGERLDLDQGHVGMVIGSRARQTLWEPLAAWLSRPTP